MSEFYELPDGLEAWVTQLPDGTWRVEHCCGRRVVVYDTWHYKVRKWAMRRVGMLRVGS